ncbi:MAG TPA: radical SAM protein [Candidatus Woesearchaeota archaeon]|nr:radical SAM protein [Candidatus Woesearchaeota archaeon]
MQELCFNSLKLYKRGSSALRVYLYRYFYRDFEIKQEFDCRNGCLYAKNEDTTNRIINTILIGLNESLTNALTGKKAKYINSNTGLPLIGNNAFGIVDRNTNWIEVKPVTGCNLNCIFCSVDQEKREWDFVVELDYLLEYYNLVASKKSGKIIAVINSHGEPLIYEPITELVRGLKRNSKTEKVVLLTNGTLLTKEKLDELKNAGLDKINFSVSAVDIETAKRLSGVKNYNIGKILGLIDYASKNFETLIAPVYMKGINDEEIEKVVKICAEKNIEAGIQNFLEYKTGRKPAKEISFEKFNDFLKELEQRHGTKLRDLDFNLQRDKSLDMPFRKNQVVECRILLPGRMKNERIGVVKGISRAISIFNCEKSPGTFVKAKITRTKHNIFSAVPA